MKDNFNKLFGDISWQYLNDEMDEFFKEHPEAAQLIAVGRMIGRADIVRQLIDIVEAEAESVETLKKLLEDDGKKP